MNSFVNKFDVTLITLFTLPDIYREAHINTARAIAMGAIAMGAIIKELLLSTPLLKKGVFRTLSA
ncbi:hypothetical protein D8S35_07900 [Salmonella enterica subsp. enterica]|nr:hypothetical protein [Salmonella enterica subsp. enterica]